MSANNDKNKKLFELAHLSPHSALLGSEFLSFDEESSTIKMRFEVKPELITGRGGVQGGFVAGYLDEVMGWAHVAATGGEQAPLNLEISMSLIRLISIGSIIGTGRVVKSGRRVLFLEGELHAEDGTLLARATSTAIPTPRPVVEASQG